MSYYALCLGTAFIAYGCVRVSVCLSYLRLEADGLGVVDTIVECQVARENPRPRLSLNGPKFKFLLMCVVRSSCVNINWLDPQ